MKRARAIDPKLGRSRVHLSTLNYFIVREMIIEVIIKSGEITIGKDHDSASLAHVLLVLLSIIIRIIVASARASKCTCVKATNPAHSQSIVIQFLYR